MPALSTVIRPRRRQSTPHGSRRRTACWPTRTPMVRSRSCFPPPPGKPTCRALPRCMTRTMMACSTAAIHRSRILGYCRSQAPVPRRRSLRCRRWGWLTSAWCPTDRRQRRPMATSRSTGRPPTSYRMVRRWRRPTSRLPRRRSVPAVGRSRPKLRPWCRSRRSVRPAWSRAALAQARGCSATR